MGLPGNRESQTAARVLLVEDSAIYASGLETLLEANGFVVAGVARNHAEALKLAKTADADIALVDLRIPDGAKGPLDARNGLGCIRALTQAAPQLRVLAMTAVDEPGLALEVVQAGASGFVSKEVAPNKIVEALRTIAGGGVVLTAAQLRELKSAPATPSVQLTPREIEVLRLVEAEKSNVEIAEALGVTVGTARTHVGNIREKLGVQTRREAVREAKRRRLL